MMANSKGVDFERVRAGLTQDYPRAQDMPGPGFAAGPCLFKDTMQLAAFSDNTFQLGHSAMLVNEGLPLYIASQLDEAHDLSDKTVGILGMAFKAGSDDIRSSLSYKLQRVLRFKAKDVLATDPYVPASVDSSLLPLDEVLERADILIVATPAPRVPRHRDRQAGRRRVEPPRQRGAHLSDPARLDRRPRVQRGRGDRPVPRRA